MPERVVAIVDGDSLVHRAFHALPPSLTAPDGRPTNAVFGLVSMLLKMVADLRPDGVVVTFDKGGTRARRELLERYKVHRPPAAPELKMQFPMAKEVLAAMGVPIVEVDGYEGDDILGTLADRGKKAGMKVLLVTGDRDALQLVDEDVEVVTTRKGVSEILVYDAEAVKERFGVTPVQIPDYLGLKGDTSDNIPGVPGVGEKTAAKLVAEYGSLDEVLAHAGEIKGRLGENLREHAEDALVSRQVATILRDVPVEIDLAEVEWGRFDTEELYRVFSKYAFRTLVERVFTTVRGGKAPSEAGVDGEADGREPWPTVADGGSVERWLAEDPEEWLGVASVEAGDTLFASRLLAYARGRGASGEAAVESRDEGTSVLPRVLREGRVSSADVKALLRLDCPPPFPRAACDDPLAAVDPARLFDCSLAAYLLESNRAVYDIAGLYGEYLRRRLPPEDDARRRAAAEAQAALELMPVLRGKLEETAATDVFERIEMPLAPVLVRMEAVGVGIDRDVLAGLSKEMEGQIAGLTHEIHELAGAEFTIDSPKQLAEVLFENLGLPATKRTKTGYSTDASVLAALAPAHPIAAKVVTYRELAKLKSTYVDALPRLLGEDGRLHTTFNQTVTATGRLSSSNPNLQNIPVRTELGRRIRAAFVPAREGDVIVSADYSQIELRILAHLSRDPALVDAFTSGTDFHAATASRVFGVPADELTPEHRRRAKAINFGIVYGISAHGLSESLGIGKGEAQVMIDRYFAAYPRVRAYLDETVAQAHRTGFAATLFGRRRYTPEIASGNYNLRSFGERTAMNHPMQGTAADIIKLAMIGVDRRLRDEGWRSRMVLQVHDELVFESPAEEVGPLAGMLREIMCGAVELAVPLVVDVSQGGDWASAK